jgi:CheY-like chemotaxis protein
MTEDWSSTVDATVLSGLVADEAIHVLHVDDDAAFLDLAAAFLTRHGLAVTTAESPAAAREVLAAESIDCVVSDYDLPGEDGIEFLRAVREEYPTLPFVLFTGKGSEEVASEAISAGVTDYLQKELGTEQWRVLANRVENLVERRRSEGLVECCFRAIETAPEGVSLLDEAGRLHQPRVRGHRRLRPPGTGRAPLGVALPAGRRRRRLRGGSPGGSPVRRVGGRTRLPPEGRLRGHRRPRAVVR